MLIKDSFLGIKVGGHYNGKIGTFVEFAESAEDFGAVNTSPTKLANRIIRDTPKTVRSVFLCGEVTSQRSDELAFLIGDLLDIKRNVIVTLDEDESLGNISAMPSWVIVTTFSGKFNKDSSNSNDILNVARLMHLYSILDHVTLLYLAL